MSTGGLVLPGVSPCAYDVFSSEGLVVGSAQINNHIRFGYFEMLAPLVISPVASGTGANNHSAAAGDVTKDYRPLPFFYQFERLNRVGRA